MDNILSIVTFIPAIAAGILALFLHGEDVAAQRNDVVEDGSRGASRLAPRLQASAESRLLRWLFCLSPIGTSGAVDVAR